MGCGCKDKKAPVPRVPADRLLITCYCGLARLIPEEAQVGHPFQLAPCPTCGAPFEGVLVSPTMAEVR